MHLLSCPYCQAELTVTPAQAGDSIPCTKCQQTVAIPKLGELRKLPRSGPVEAPAAPARGSAGNSVLASVGFAALSLIAVSCVLIALYTGIRWANSGAEMTTETHLQEIETLYRESDAATMITHYETMEENSLDLIVPYTYQAENNEKAGWGRNSLTALTVAALAAVGAFVAAKAGRPKAAGN